ncbi:hypothetical protein AB6B38_12365 [Glycocaulis abyssi]|uniref:Uncharacterized protein n=1 Tax=Glycocaulis abyssi TaxID=1433403 RepID=A0ABV9NIY5_9PROT
MSEINKVEQLKLLMNVHVQLRTLKDIGWTQWLGVQEGMRMAFYVDGIHYDFVVHECVAPVRPGEQGEADFLTLSDAILDTGVKIGSVIELRGGAAVLGHARINSIARVWIVRDRSTEKGYRFSRGPVPI